jgi:hypothetical protein
VTPSDLHPGDVLLYVKTRRFDDLVRLLDGGTYSHAGIYNGAAVIEALPPGVIPRPLETSILHAEVVDVFRLRLADGRMLGEDPAFPADPVVQAIARFEAEHDRYAYDALPLLSFLCLTRKIHVGEEPDSLIREVLDSGAEAIYSLIDRGREPMICSELVYRCYAQAGPAYRIQISGLDGERISQSLGRPFAERHAAYKRAYALAQPVVPDFVTPHDLESSPNLERIGRLKG